MTLHRTTTATILGNTMTITRQGVAIQMIHQQGVEPRLELQPGHKLEHGQRPGQRPGQGLRQLEPGPKHGLKQGQRRLGPGLKHRLEQGQRQLGLGPHQLGQKPHLPGLGLERGLERGPEPELEQDPPELSTK